MITGLTTNEDSSLISLIGKTVRCTSLTEFSDNTKHEVGSLHTVTKETEAYYKMFLKNGYRLIINSKR